MIRNLKKGFSLILVLAAMIVFVACSIDTKYDESSMNIIEPAQVGQEISSPDVVVIDARDKDKYEKGHLKGAINLTAGELSENTPVKGMIAPKKTFERILSKNGINSGDKVYIYDDKNGIFASRIWWVFKYYGHDQVKVINQGARGLELQGLEMSADAPMVEKSKYKVASKNEDLLVKIDEVKAQVDNPQENVIILDTRTKAEFDEGAIPGAINYSHSNNCYKDGTFKSKQDIYLNYTDLGIDVEDEVYVYCKTSVRAAQTAALMQEAGFKNVKVYDGAWLEWQYKGMPTTGAEDKVVPTVQDAS
jgi:thiosulfate/3-mercaptopyruvate sulfurtransferase